MTNKNIHYVLEQFKERPIERPDAFSFEFFPPKTPEMERQLQIAMQELASLKPDFMTVTYGAGGSTRSKTAEIAAYIQETTHIPAAAHITSVNATREMIQDVLDDYAARHIRHVIALRGDMPGFMGEYTPLEGGYAYAKDLVEAIAARKQFEISVAGYPETHPQARSEQDDLYHLKEKVEAGATRIITQYCFDTDTVLRYVDKVRKMGMGVNIVPGIMLIAHFKQMCKFSSQCGASVPKWVHDLCEGVDDDPSLRFSVSVAIAVEQCRLLMQEGINQFHFYSLNRHEAAKAVCQLLGIGSTAHHG